jgi:Ca2+-binding EF-hand superfamily protein
MKRFFFAMLCLALAPAFSRSAELPALAAADYQDVIFVSAGGPVRLRFHLPQEGKTVTQQWQGFTDQVFDYADRNGDGKLDKGEVQFLSMLMSSNSMSGSYGIADLDVDGLSDVVIASSSGSVGMSVPPNLDFATLDADKNGFVSREEFTKSLARSGSGPIRVVLSQGSGMTDQLTAALFAQLDKNKDGKLSKEELDGALDILMKLDQDDDDIITSNELLQRGRRNTGVYAPAIAFAPGGGPARTPSTPNAEFFTIRRDASLAETVKELLAQLDKDKNGKLSAPELKMSAEGFAKLDKNGDGQLDSAEIENWLKSPVDVVVTIPLGGTPNGMEMEMMKRKGRKDQVLEMKAAKGPFETAIRTGKNGIPELVLADAVLTLSRSQNNQNGIFFVNFFDQGGNLDEIFKKAQGANKGLDKKKLRETRELQYLMGFFDIADRNGDGILELAELKKLQSVQSAGTNIQVELHITDEGRSLFDLIDTDHDGRLGIREIRNAWNQLARLSKDGKTVAREDLPKKIPMYTNRANLAGSMAGYAYAVTTDFISTRAPSSPVGRKGPVWFLKMDRNGDGDVSRKEFLGPPELFDKLDKDGDGLISVEEAVNAEKEQKK